MEERQTVAGAYQKIESHEDLCAERYRNIGVTLAELKEGAKTHNKLVVGVLIALLGWMGAQLLGPVLHPVQTSTQTQITSSTQTSQAPR